MQTKEELEQWYANPDPWAYTTTQDDHDRKKIILSMFSPKGYTRALDIGAGEGFITQDLPAIFLDAIELSDLAASRLPKKVNRVHRPVGLYDLVVTMGTLYKQYNHEEMAHLIRISAMRHVLVAGIKDWLLPYEFGKVVSSKEFQYREYVQKVTLYEVGT
jgi:hypothetical protein